MSTGNIWYTAEQWAEVNEFTNEPIKLRVLDITSENPTLEEWQYAHANEMQLIMNALTKEEFLNAPHYIQWMYMMYVNDSTMGIKIYNEAKQKHPEYFPN